MEFLKAVAALIAVFYATAIIGCLGSDLCYDLGTEAWWATIGRMAVYSPLVHRFLETDHMRRIHFSRHGL